MDMETLLLGMSLGYLHWERNFLEMVRSWKYQSFYQAYKFMAERQRKDFTAYVNVATRQGKLSEEVSQASWVASCHVAWGMAMCPDENWQEWGLDRE